MDDYPSLASSVSERRLANVLRLLRNLSLEVEDVVAHLTEERIRDKMTATTGEDLAGEQSSDLDCASNRSDPFGAGPLSRSYD